MKPTRKIELTINDNSARERWGIIMTDNTVGQLMSPPAMKAYYEYSCRFEHGSRVLIYNPKIDSRDVTLELRMLADTAEEFHLHFKDFLDYLSTCGEFELWTPYIPNKRFKLIYRSCSQFTRFNGVAATLSLKLIEPNPTKGYV